MAFTETSLACHLQKTFQKLSELKSHLVKVEVLDDPISSLSLGTNQALDLTETKRRTY